MRARYTVAGRERHKKVLKRAKGFLASRRYRIKVAKEAVTHAMRHEYVGRKQKKRDFRALWITRLNAFVRAEGITYSRFINGLNKSKVDINRKLLAYLAVTDPDALRKYVEIAKVAVGK
jgi:large subunit ribosomal protein L20